MNRLILLVDDNAIQAASRKAILERSGQKVAITLHGQAALEILSDPVERRGIGLVITDHLMPGMNGPELVRELRKLDVDLPVIVLSGLPDAAAEYADLKVVFRMKPLPPDFLIRLSGELLSERMPRTA